MENRDYQNPLEEGRHEQTIYVSDESNQSSPARTINELTVREERDEGEPLVTIPQSQMNQMLD